ISLVVMPPAIYLTRKVARMRRAITAEQQRELADLNVTIEEGLSVNGVQLAKTMGAGPALVRRFTASSARLIDLELRSQLAGRWRMSSLTIIFATIPAHLPRGRTAGHGRRRQHRHPGRLHHPAEQPVPADHGPARHERVGDQLAGAVRADLRVPGPAGRG